MGEVYKARDTRLNRTVAIKVLPEHVAADPDLKQRFEREAKTVAALSHPHICPTERRSRQLAGVLDLGVARLLPLQGKAFLSRHSLGVCPSNSNDPRDLSALAV